MKILAYQCNILSHDKNNYLPDNIEVVNQLEKNIAYDHEVLIWNNNFAFTPHYLKSFPKLKLFINWGVDDANIQTSKQFIRKGITVKKVDYYSIETLSEYVLGLILNFERKLNFLMANQKITGNEIYGKKIGIIGLGKIGFRVAQIFKKSFNSEIYYYARKDKLLEKFKYASVKTIFKICDYVIIAVKSANFSIKIKSLGKINKNLVIINISNDSVLPIKKIIPLLESNRIRGYIGDLFNVNVEKNNLPENVTLINHYGYLSHEAISIKHNILYSYIKKIPSGNTKSQIYLIRHGQTEWNKDGIFQGSQDSPLTKSGRETAKKIAKVLKDKHIERIYTSPLGRAKKTAEIIAREINGKITVIPQFQEMNFGIFEGKKQKIVRALFKDFFEKREKNKFCKLYEAFPEGESYFDVFLRVVKNLVSILPLDQNCVIVGHESINRIIRGIIRELPLEEMVNLKQENRELITINFHTLEESVAKIV